MKGAKPLTDGEILGYLLGQYGSNQMDAATFWAEMNARGYTQAHIDSWCDEFYRLEAKKEQDNAAQRSRAEASATARTGREETRRGQQEDHRQERQGDEQGVRRQGPAAPDQDAQQENGEAQWERPVNEIFETAGGRRIIVNHYRHVIVGLTPEERDHFIKIGHDRHHSKGVHFADATRLNPEHLEKEDEIGSVGEGGFSKLTGLPMNTEIMVTGDNGIDFIFTHSRDNRPVTVAVSTAQKPDNLLMRAETTETRKHAEIWVLAGISPDWLSLIFLGYQTRDYMLSMPRVPARDPKLAAEGRINHECKQSRLLPMRPLLRAIRQ